VLKNADVKKRIELTIIGMGVIIFIFLIISYMPKPKVNKTVSGTEPYSASKIAMAADSKAESWDSVRWGKDPFLPDGSNVKEQGMEGLNLNGIVSGENPYAIINNEVVKLGDKVDDMTVIEINEKSVVLDQDGKKHTLELNVN
jgi:type II secretory pathway component PulC